MASQLRRYFQHAPIGEKSRVMRETGLAYSTILRAEGRAPSVATAQKIAAVVPMTVAQVLGLDEWHPPAEAAE